VANPRLLHIDSSITGAQSVSRQLTARITARLKSQQPGLEILYRDLAANPVPHHTGEILAAKSVGVAGPELAEDFDAITQALEDFMASDIIVIGLPMYNFSIPSQLKTWIDCLAVPGRTFSYGEGGVKGLAGGKRVILASARGNAYTEDPYALMDYQETFVRGFFGFIGISDIEIIRAEGVAFGPEQRESALNAALTQADALSVLEPAG
jgi:FMN-dependent NADH-azoreductase